MSAISYAMNELFHVVDRTLLEQAYLQNSTGQAPCAFASLDQVIIDTTLYGRVMGDIQLLGGMQKHLCTAHGEVIQQDGFGTVYHYNDEDLHGHSIMTALSFFPGLTCLNGISPLAPCAMNGAMFASGMAALGVATVNNLNSLANQLVGNQIHGPQAIITPRVVAHNSIMIDRNNIVGYSGIFKVIISHDEALNDLNPRSWRAFADLLIAAVRAHIYQTMRSRLLRGALQYGQEYGIYTAMLQEPEFTDAEAAYREQRTIWSRVAYVNDKARYASFLRISTRNF